MRAWKGQRWTKISDLADYINAARDVAGESKLEKLPAIYRALNRWEPGWRKMLEENKYGGRHEEI